MFVRHGDTIRHRSANYRCPTITNEIDLPPLPLNSTHTCRKPNPRNSPSESGEILRTVPMHFSRSITGIIFVTLCCVRVAGAGSLVDGMTIEADGSLRVGDVRMDVVYFSPEWRCSRQSQGAVSVKITKSDSDRWSASGAYSLADSIQTFAFQQDIQRVDPHGIRYSVHLSCPEGIPANQLACSLRLPVSTHRAGRVILDDRPVELPIEPLPSSVNASGVKQVVVFTTEGKLTFAGDLKVSIQDGRNHASKEHFCVRFLFSESRGTIRDSRLEMTIRYEPYACQPVDLSKNANRAFEDVVRGQTSGGETDESSSKIRMLTPGTIKVGGLGFRVLDPNRNSGKSCLVFGGAQRSHLAGKCRGFAFREAARVPLSAACRVPGENQRAGRNGSH